MATKLQISAGMAWAIALLVVLGSLAAAFPEAIAGRALIAPSARLTNVDALYTPVGPLPTLRAVDPSPEVAFQPWDAWIMASLRRGEPPVWAPEMGFGTPLLANGQSAPLSPYKLAALAPSGGVWTTGFLLGRLAITGAGMLALLAYMGLSPAAAVVGALAFMLHSHFLNFVSFSDVHVYMALPWLLLLGERLRRVPGRRALAAFGLGIGGLALLGHAEGAVYSAAGACLVLAVGLRADGWPVSRVALLLAGAGTLGGLVAAVVVLPFGEFVTQATSYLFGDRHGFARGLTLAARAGHAVTDLLAPNPAGSYYDAYVGVVPAVLAVLGLTRAGARRPGLALVMLGFACFLVFPPDNLGPLIKLAPNSFYAAPLLALGLALLAAEGAEALRQAPRALAVRALGAAALVGGLALSGLAWAAVPAAQPLGGAAPYLLALAAVLLAQGFKPWPGRALGAVLVVLTAVDLGRAAHALAPPMPFFDYPRTPILAHLAALPQPYRVASRGALAPGTNLVHGVPLMNVMDAFLLRRYIGYNDAVAPDWGPNGYQADLLDLASVDWLVLSARDLNPAFPRQAAAAPARYPLRLSQPGVALHQNLTALPRARVLHSAEVLPTDHRAATARLAATPARWREVALVETPDGRPLDGLGTAPVAATPATVTAYGALHVAVETTLDRPGLLVLADAYYPGWVAEVDGVAAPIFPTYVAFRGVWLGAGAHHVDFRYRSPVLALGFGLSLLGLLFGLWALWRPDRRYQPLR